MGNMIWTPKMDAKMFAMLKEGKSYMDIAQEVGLMEIQVRKRHGYLKSKERKAAEAQTAEPKMSELEEAQQELISELTAEKDELQGQLQTARNEADELRAALLHLNEKNGHLEQLLKEANEELEETHDTLGRMEDRCDRLGIRVAELEEEQRRYIKVILGLSEKVCEI